VIAADYFHQLRTPQVAIEVRCFELGPEMVAVFSLVEELFETDQVTAAFAEFVALVDALADGSGWDRMPGLPDAVDPGSGGGLRLGLLPEPAVRHREGPPADDLEQAVADVFEELLEVPVLDRAADFFGLGGDSLLAVRAVVRLAKEVGGSVPVREFLADSTVAGVAAVVRARLGDQR
jgi:acyl carrier protein